MHTHTTDDQKHSHVFLGEQHESNERKTKLVILVTTLMMFLEIIGGTFLGSMALVADGWHMSTHAGALAISAFAYMYARRHKNDPDFAFGTGKLGDLAGFTSAIILAMISLFIIYQSAERLIHPVPIVFGEAIGVATLGLIINVLSAWLLRDSGHHHHHAMPFAKRSADKHHHDHHHHHDHEHDHEHDHGHSHDHTTTDGHAHLSSRHQDNNIRSAYIHVIADAAVSVLAISGLLMGLFYGWVWMDPIMGIVGSLVIANWAYTLTRDTGRVLLDVTPDKKLAEDIRKRFEKDGDSVTDLHLWQVGPGHYGAIVSLISDNPRPPSVYKATLHDLKTLSHLTVEVHPCTGAAQST